MATATGKGLGTVDRVKRSGDVRLKIADDIAERLGKISRVYGMPPSTLAALAVGTWVAQQERALLMVESMANSVGAQMGDAIATELRQSMATMIDAAGKEA
jgi:hypothetical protein